MVLISILRWLSLCAIAFIVLSCATPAKKIKDLNQTYDQMEQELQPIERFGFEQDGHKYNFAPLYVKENGFECLYYLGFKSNELVFHFPIKELEKLRTIYAAKIPIEEKMRKILSNIETFSKVPLTCDKNFGQRQSSITEDALNFVVWGGLGVALLPISLFFGGGQVLTDGWKEHNFDKRLKTIRLGMSSKQVSDILEGTLTAQPASPYVISRFQNEKRDLIFVFKEQRLIAFVWSYPRKSN